MILSSMTILFDLLIMPLKFDLNSISFTRTTEYLKIENENYEENNQICRHKVFSSGDSLTSNNPIRTNISNENHS